MPNPNQPPAEFDPDLWLDQQLVKMERIRGGITLTETGVEFPDFAGVQRYARMLIEAECVPIYKTDWSGGQLNQGEFLYSKVLARVTLCILLGRRVGLTPEESVSSIYVVNSRTTIFGDAPLAIARQHAGWVEAGYKEYFEVWDKTRNEYVRVKGNPAPEQFKEHGTRCVVETLRKGATEAKVHTYSIADAIAAGVMKNEQYAKNPHRMLRFRARGHNLRDNFGDALKGFGIREVVEDEETSAAADEPKAPPTGSVDLRTLKVSPPITTVPPPPPLTRREPTSVPPPPVNPPAPPPPPPVKKRTTVPPPPAPVAETNPMTALIEELTLLDANAYMDWLGRRGVSPEDVEDSTGDTRAEWINDLQSEVRRLTLKLTEG
jgi:hypothetical protein